MGDSAFDYAADFVGGLEALGADSVRQVRFYIDGKRIALSDAVPYRTWWQLVPGEHQVWAEAVLADGSLVLSDIVAFSISAN